MPFGGEQLWTRMFDPNPLGISLSTFRYAVHESAAWDWRSFDLDADVALADDRSADESSTADLHFQIDLFVL